VRARTGPAAGHRGREACPRQVRMVPHPRKATAVEARRDRECLDLAWAACRRRGMAAEVRLKFRFLWARRRRKCSQGAAHGRRLNREAGSNNGYAIE
jgi:hypothetical protein